jgi:hypothetical protein
MAANEQREHSSCIAARLKVCDFREVAARAKHWTLYLSAIEELSFCTFLQIWNCGEMRPADDAFTDGPHRVDRRRPPKSDVRINNGNSVSVCDFDVAIDLARLESGKKT